MASATFQEHEVKAELEVIKDSPAHREDEEFSESRQKVIKRVHKLVYYFADKMLGYEDQAAYEKAELERQIREGPDELFVMAGTSKHNAVVMKDCMRDARDAAEFLKDRENVIEEWEIAGINAMFDQCNADHIIPYDLPTAIKGLLGMHIL